MATALQGAIIEKQSGTTVVFKKKCEKCGDVSHSDTTTQINSGSIYNFQFSCVKCKNTQKVQIKG